MHLVSLNLAQAKKCNNLRLHGQRPGGGELVLVSKPDTTGEGGGTFHKCMGIHFTYPSGEEPRGTIRIEES